MAWLNVGLWKADREDRREEEEMVKEGDGREIWPNYFRFWAWPEQPDTGLRRDHMLFSFTR